MSKLSERVRPDVEAAPWVVEKIKNLEAERDALILAVADHVTVRAEQYGRIQELSEALAEWKASAYRSQTDCAVAGATIQQLRDKLDALAARGKEAGNLPSEEQREEILNTARKSFRHAQSSCRGQQITESDDPDTHVIWATWDMCAKLFLAPQPAIPEGMALVGYTAPETIINLRNGTRYGGARISPRVDEEDGLTAPIYAAAGVAP